MSRRLFAVLFVSLTALLVTGIFGCGERARVAVDGSSTVFPVTEAVAEEFLATHPQVQVTVGISGTGGGFKKFSAGEIDICDASRKIKESEIQACKASGVEYLEFTIAYDGLSVVVHPENDWCDCLTVEQLNELWKSDSTVKSWRDLNPEWPDEPITLYGPGTDSGTFDYFTKAINGEEKDSRADYAASEDDNVLVNGIAADRYALGYFGFAYYAENRDKLKLLGVDGGDGCVKPSRETVRGGDYTPLSRPLFVYVRRSSLARPQVAEFVRFYLSNAEKLVGDVGYVPVSEDEAQENQGAFDEALSTLGQEAPTESEKQ